MIRGFGWEIESRHGGAFWQLSPKSGLVVLALSSSGFDPIRTSARVYLTYARRRVRLYQSTPLSRYDAAC